MDQRAVFAVDWVLGWTRNPFDRGNRFLPILLRAALIIAACSRISPNDQKICARFQALMTGARRKDSNIARLEVDDAALSTSKPNLGVAACDAKDFMDARVIVGIVIDAVAP